MQTELYYRPPRLYCQPDGSPEPLSCNTLEQPPVTRWVAQTRACVCARSCLTLRNPMNCSPSGSSVHGISQARTREWFAISSSRGSLQPRDWIHVSCIGRQICDHWVTWEAHVQEHKLPSSCVGGSVECWLIHNGLTWVILWIWSSFMHLWRISWAWFT